MTLWDVWFTGGTYCVIEAPTAEAARNSAYVRGLYAYDATRFTVEQITRRN